MMQPARCEPAPPLKGPRANSGGLGWEGRCGRQPEGASAPRVSEVAGRRGAQPPLLAGFCLVWVAGWLQAPVCPTERDLGALFPTVQ